MKRPYQYRQSVRLSTPIKQIQLTTRMNCALMLLADSICIFDLILNRPRMQIRRVAQPRSMRLAKSGNFFLAQFTDNNTALFDMHGHQIIKIVGIPRATYLFVLSDNSQKMLYGNNQTVCLWDIATAQIQIMTTQWRNVNCYALRGDAAQFVLGTYDGGMLVLTVVAPQRCLEMHLKKHKSCIMSVCYRGMDEIVSVAYDKCLLTTCITLAATGEKVVTYSESHILHLPKTIEKYHNVTFLFYAQLMQFLQGDKLQELANGLYSVGVNQVGEIVIVKYDKAVLQFYLLK